MTSLALEVLLLVAGIGTLYFGAEWLVRGAARLAGSLGVSPIVVGLTVVSFGTSAPELVVCSVAAFRDNADLAVGNVMGSNLANMGLILGLTALVRPLDVASRVVWREVPLMVIVTAAFYPLAFDGELGRGDGVVFLLALAAYLLFVFQSVEDEAPEIMGEYEEFLKESSASATRVRLGDVGLVVAGCACLVLGGYAIVEAATAVAGFLGVSQTVIGLSVVAVGTSLPELATSVVAAMHDEADIAVGNVVGSNIFNFAAILGTASVIRPLPIAGTVLTRELPAVLIMSALLFPMLRTGWRIQRWEGAVLLGGYLWLGYWLI
ncbi:MAG TPA: calcium/sodium antiporter [Longimicrobiales bacterium]|nr:calcium/sodium antiporter [Longimicrobiales bacterium]